MTLNVVYRCTVYAPRGLDPTETTVLTPVAGAPHAQQFKIATSEGISGFQPYMGMPTGRRGRIDILAKKTDTGELSFDVLDTRVTPGGSNLQRWLTAFVGDLKGLPRMARLKAFVEESLDGGVTWSAFFTGRVKSFGMKTGSRVLFTMVLRDLGDDLTFNIFTGRPHGSVYQTTSLVVRSPFTSTTLADSTQAWTVNQWVGATVTITKGLGVGQRRTVVSNTATVLTVNIAWTTTPDATSFYSFGYAQLISVLPVGFVYPYGGSDIGGNPIIPVTQRLNGSIGPVDATNGWARLDLAAQGANWLQVALNTSLYAGVAPTQVYSYSTDQPPAVNSYAPPQFTGVAVCRLQRKDTLAEGDFQVGFIIHTKSNDTGPMDILRITTTSISGMAIRPVSYPLGVATGTPLANGAQAASAAANSQVVNTKGWTTGVTGILAGGDVISFAGHLQRYNVVATVNSDGGGLSAVTLQPGLQSAIVDGEAITVQKSPARMAIPPQGTLVRFNITCDMRLADGGTQDPVTGRYQAGNLLLINDVHPVQVLRDVVLGFYGRIYQPTYNSHSIPTLALPPGKNLGDPWFPIAVKDTDPVGDGRHGFTALLADGTFPPFRCIVDKQMPIKDFIETYLCKPYGIGYYLDQSGAFVPVDMRQPGAAIAGITTITDADLVDESPPTWTYDPSQAVVSGAYTVYAEGIVQPIAARIQTGDTLPSITTKMMDVQGGRILDLALGNPDLGQKEYQLDGKGYRAMPGETNVLYQFGSGLAPTTIIQSRWDMMMTAIQDMATKTAKRPYGNGPQLVTMTAVRNANTAPITPGGFFVLNVASNPDVATNTRGPARLIMCSERTEDGPKVKLAGVDWGLTGIANVPSLATPTTLFGDTSHSEIIVVTLNAQNEAAEVWYNVTATSVGTRPADTDPAWSLAGWATVTNQVVTMRRGPSGGRVWWRARTNPQRAQNVLGVDLGISGMKTPSAWRYPSSTGGTDFADLTTMTAPSGLASPIIGANAFTVVWTPADASRMVEIWLATPVTDVRQRIAVLPAGSNRFVFSGLVASSAYRVAIREIDGVGGYAEATIDVTTISTPPIINPPYNTRITRVLT